jgi:hypothetical protein
MQETYRTIKNRSKPKDIFYTPLSVVKIHLDLVRPFIKEKDIIYDPFYGKGIYYNSFDFKNTTKIFSEIDMGKDFFEFNEKIDVIISNPPYSCIDKVFEKSVDLNPHTISYLLGFHNLTTKRIEYMNKKGYFLTKIHLTKIYEWFGMSIIVVFTKTSENCISYDRIVHRIK